MSDFIKLPDGKVFNRRFIIHVCIDYCGGDNWGVMITHAQGTWSLDSNGDEDAAKAMQKEIEQMLLVED